MAPGRYTELFFLDDATALAAGHRACAECRRADYNRLTEVWAVIHPEQAGADAIDDQLHSERVAGLHDGRYRELPDGAFVLEQETPCMVLGSRLLEWSPGGYLETRRRTRGNASVITPPSLLAVLARGWEPLVPLMHPSARVVSST